MNTLITISPVSKPYLQSFSDKYLVDKDIKNFDMANLRRFSTKDLLKELRKIDTKNLYLGYEEANGKKLLPILIIIAFFTKAKQLWVVDENLQSSKISRFFIFKAVFQLIWGTLVAHVNLFLCLIELKGLIKAKRENFSYEGNNILYLKTNLWFGVQVGGSIGHISGVVNAFIEKAFKVFFYSMETPIMLSNEVEINKFSMLETYGLPQEVNLYSFQRHSVKEFKRIHAQNKTKFSFIYSRMAVSNYANVLLSRLLRIPLILEYNGSEVWVSEKWGTGLRYRNSAQLAEDVCLKHAHLIVVVSDVLKQELISRGIEEERVLFYPNCIDPEVFSPQLYAQQEKEKLRANYKLDPDHKIFTFVGTFGQWHGAEKFAEAIRNLCLTKRDWLIKEKVHFMLIGNGVKMQDVQALIDNESCSEFVTLTGLIPQKEAPLHLAASNVLMSPHVPNADGSKFFGSPTKLFEYMAMGKGIIASDLDQIGEVLQNSIRINELPVGLPTESEKRASLLVEPGNVKDIENAIIFMASNPEWADTLGSNARALTLEKYTWNKHISEIMSTFEKQVQK